MSPSNLHKYRDLSLCITGSIPLARSNQKAGIPLVYAGFRLVFYYYLVTIKCGFWVIFYGSLLMELLMFFLYAFQLLEHSEQLFRKRYASFRAILKD